MLRWIIRALAILVIARGDARRPRLRRDPRSGRAGRHGVDGRHDPGCDGRVLAAGPPRTDSSTRAAADRRGARGRDGRRRRSSPIATPTDRTLVLRVAAGPGDVIVGARRLGLRERREVRRHHDRRRSGRSPFPTSSTSCSATTAPPRSTAARSGRCSGTRSSPGCSPSTGRCATSPFRLGQSSGAPPGKIDCD